MQAANNTAKSYLKLTVQLELTIVILRMSSQTWSGTGTFGSNLRADTLELTICRNDCTLELAAAFLEAETVALVVAAFAKATAEEINILLSEPLSNSMHSSPSDCSEWVLARPGQRYLLYLVNDLQQATSRTVP